MPDDNVLDEVIIRVRGSVEDTVTAHARRKKDPDE